MFDDTQDDILKDLLDTGEYEDMGDLINFLLAITFFVIFAIIFVFALGKIDSETAIILACTWGLGMVNIAFLIHLVCGMKPRV